MSNFVTQTNVCFIWFLNLDQVSAFGFLNIHVCFVFVGCSYQLTKFTFGSHVLELYCLQSASRQLVWPGAMLMNGYLSENADILQGCSVLELGSGVGITGVLCSKFCRKVIFTDHNDEILKKNIDLHGHSSGPKPSAELEAAKLEWGNSDQLGQILKKHNDGFDLILGADIYILMFVNEFLIYPLGQWLILVLSIVEVLCPDLLFSFHQLNRNGHSYNLHRNEKDNLDIT
ncbi:putative lysine methyltransferase, S-adenosyl-L-methionine-dependent methyltransferase [Arabidopsis thaliana]